MATLSPNTQAILLLAAPLIVGRGHQGATPLTPTEYRRLARKLHELNAQPADLLGPQLRTLLTDCACVVEASRLEQLLGRGFLLSQAIERWQARAIWVLSRADAEYPRRLKSRVKEDAPPIIYGCGDASLLAKGGLAVVGSRHVDDELAMYADATGRMVADAHCTLVSGGARGIDQSAMGGALDAGGAAVGVLADSLERSAIHRAHREMLMDGRLVLISPYDPAAGFNVGHAMRRNRLIYALADAALVISSDYAKGGTWAGAVEQLEKLHYVPVYVRVDGTSQKGLEALRARGAVPWPQPDSAEQLTALLQSSPVQSQGGRMRVEPEFSLISEPMSDYKAGTEPIAASIREAPQQLDLPPRPTDDRFAEIRELLGRMDVPQSEQEVASVLQVTKAQARKWLHQLVAEGVLKRLNRPVRYQSTASTGSLFDKTL